MRSVTTASRKSSRAASKATCIARPTASSPSARAAWPTRWLRSASASATVSRRWRGTATATWSCTTRRRARRRCCTRSIRACTPDQVVWIADHAEDQILFFDLTFLPLIEAIAARVKTIKHFVAMTDRDHMPVGVDGAEPALLRRADRSRVRPISRGRRSTRTRPRRCATRRAPPATPRARCTATDPRCCTPTPAPCRIRSTALRATRSCRSCRCSTSTPGACPTWRAWSAPSSCSPARGSTASRCTSCSRPKA